MQKKQQTSRLVDALFSLLSAPLARFTDVSSKLSVSFFRIHYITYLARHALVRSILEFLDRCYIIRNFRNVFSLLQNARARAEMQTLSILWIE